MRNVNFTLSFQNHIFFESIPAVSSKIRIESFCNNKEWKKKRDSICQTTLLCRKLEQRQSFIAICLKTIYNKGGSHGELESERYGHEKICHCKCIFIFLFLLYPTSWISSFAQQRPLWLRFHLKSHLMIYYHNNEQASHASLFCW